MLNFYSDLSQKHLSMSSIHSFLIFISLSLLLWHCHLHNRTQAVRLFPKDSLIKLLMSILSFSRIYFYFFCSKNVTVQFARRTDVMPPVPMETKYHPSAVDLLLIKRLIGETSKQNLLQFLQHEFVNIGKPHAERLIGKCHILEFSRFWCSKLSFMQKFQCIFYSPITGGLYKLFSNGITDA